MKTEKQKMIEGCVYNALDPELLASRIACKDLCFDFNQTRPSDSVRRKALLSRLLGRVHEDTWIEPTIMCDYGFNVYLGKACYINHNSLFLDCAPIVLGDHVFVGPNCNFYTAMHPLDAKNRDEGVEYACPISIGNHVWIAGNVTVLPGVTIGDHVVIGAGSIVSRDIESHSLAVGNPCRKIKEID